MEPLSRKISPKRHRGQNFLIDKNILKKIAGLAALSPEDTVLEVGPGMGALTEELVKRAGAVIAVEIDKDLFAYLSEKFADVPNLTLVKDDILDVDVASLLKKVRGERSSTLRDEPSGSDSNELEVRGFTYSIVANLPYNITSRFFRKFLEEETAKPAKMTVLVQKEVAERMTAQPPDMNLLALSVQLFADVRIAFRVSRHCFRPKPKVESAVVNLLIHPERAERVERVLRLAKAAFSQKRKQCAKTIAQKCDIPLERVLAAFERAGIEKTARAEEISLDTWKKIALLLAGQ